MYSNNYFGYYESSCIFATYLFNAYLNVIVVEVIKNHVFLCPDFQMQNIPSHHETESQDGSQCGYARSIQQHYTVDSSLVPRTGRLTAPF
jgi:hypothetical protein